MPSYNTTWLIPGEIMSLGRLAIEIASSTLQIKPPALRWVIERQDRGEWWFEHPVVGFCSRDGETVFLRRDLSAYESATTAVHEVRHVFQVRHGMRERTDRRLCERDAQRFELLFWNGEEKRNGSCDEIASVLMRRRVNDAIESRSKVTKHHGKVFTAGYPSRGQTRVIMPSPEEMEESLRNSILYGD